MRSFCPSYFQYASSSLWTLCGCDVWGRDKWFLASASLCPARTVCNIMADLKQQTHLLWVVNGILFQLSHESKRKWYQFIKYAMKQMCTHTHTQASQQHINHRTVAWSLYNFPFPISRSCAKAELYVERQLALKQWAVCVNDVISAGMSQSDAAGFDKPRALYCTVGNYCTFLIQYNNV